MYRTGWIPYHARPAAESIPFMSSVAPTPASERLRRLRESLMRLQPLELEVIDESHLHAGHAGARDGRGHFRVRVVAAAFRGERPLARHRRVYAAAGEMMQTDIHALAIEALTPEEAQ